jgi:predicted nucleotide-binding protein (sugar kinase/HSP70/actin superfamily)
MPKVMKKEDWQIEREKRLAAQAKAIASLTENQRKAIDAAYEAMQTIRTNIYDMSDLYLSDIQKLDSAFWSMYHAFNKGENKDD